MAQHVGEESHIVGHAMAPLHPTGLTGKQAVGITGPHSVLNYHIDKEQPPEQHNGIHTDGGKRKFQI